MSKRTYFYEVKFTVKGAGEFPIDMLRYDSCYPLSQEDVNKFWWDEVREVTLISVKRCKSGPTEGRWNSFGWKVIEKNGGHKRA